MYVYVIIKPIPARTAKVSLHSWSLCPHLWALMDFRQPPCRPLLALATVQLQLDQSIHTQLMFVFHEKTNYILIINHSDLIQTSLTCTHLTMFFYKIKNN